MNTSPRPVVVGVASRQSAVVRAALREAHLLGSTVRVIHATGGPAQVADYSGGIQVYESLQQAGQRVLSEVRQMVEAEPVRPQVDYLLSAVAPHQVLKEESQDASLLVLGSDEVTWFERLMGAAVTGHLARHAKCPVLVVPEGEVSEDPPGDVVIALDGESPATQALRFAFDWADRHQRGLRVLHAVDPDQATVPEAVRANISEVLAGWQEQYPHVAYSLEFAADDPDDACVHAASNASVVILGQPTGHALGLIGERSIVPRVVKAARGPVAIVPEQES